MNKKQIEIILTLIICIAVLIGVYFLLKIIFPKDSYSEFLKDYKVNEYIPTYVSDEEMAKIYLNDYINIMYSDINKAYNMLDEEYRNKKFGNIENYKNYVNSLTYSTYNMVKYYKDTRSGNLIYGVYDNNGNFYAFKTNGVLQYTVYLDDYTVEIG